MDKTTKNEQIGTQGFLKRFMDFRKDVVETLSLLDVIGTSFSLFLDVPIDNVSRLYDEFDALQDSMYRLYADYRDWLEGYGTEDTTSASN